MDRLELFMTEKVVATMDPLSDERYQALHEILDQMCQRPDLIRQRILGEVEVDGVSTPRRLSLCQGWRIQFALTETRLIVLSLVAY